MGPEDAWPRNGVISRKDDQRKSYDVPVTYLKCTDDTVVQPAHQQEMIDDFKSVSRSSVNVVEIASGHCPMVVHVEKTAEVIMNAAWRGVT